ALAMVALYYLARLDLDDEGARRAVLLATVFPFAFFFGAVYTESLFLCVTVASFYFFRTKRPLLGACFGAVATATRVNGILMRPALAWTAGGEAAPPAPSRLRALAAVLLAGGGLAAYCLYVYRLTGNPFEWATSIERWNYYPGGTPWAGLGHLLAA